MNLEKICKETIEAVKKAGAYIMEQHHSSANREIEQKGKHDFVTIVDKTAEKILVTELAKVLPEAGFIAEEGTNSAEGANSENGTNKENRTTYNWVIDPIDGTTNFIHGAFPFAVSVALIEDEQPIAGVILELGFNECFYAWKGGGAYMDNKPIHVSQTKTLNNSLVATGFPYTDFSMLEEFMETMDWFMKNSRGVRRLGSAATDIAWVACGRYDGFYEYGLKAWDVAAGIVILQEAGGKCADFSGNGNYLFDGELICSNGLNHNEFINVIRGIMKN
jgi:myo-inositol-1(or 4)-monophosphatase